MLELLLTLTPISLLDSLSAAPVALIPLAIILNGRRPVVGALSFISGGMLVYFCFGLFLLLGLDTFIDNYAQQFISYMKTEPDCVELGIQIVVGFLMIYFAYRLKSQHGEPNQDRSYAIDISPAQAFTLHASINLLGMWGALPYFAAIAQILKTDLSTPLMISTLIYYNFIFALPLLSFIILRIFMGDRVTVLLDKTSKLMMRWSKQAFIMALFALGPLLIIDGIGWFYGFPILVFT